jgi:hypothetical protein
MWRSQHKKHVRKLLEEARSVIHARMCYYYTDELRGPGADLVRQIDKELA